MTSLNLSLKIHHILHKEIYYFLNTMSESFLTAVYEKLDLKSGSLLSALHLFDDDEAKKAWLDKGDWIELAHKIGAEKVFFVKDEPVIIFRQCTENEDLKNIVLKAWCMSRPQRLFLALPTELRVYDLTRLPINKESQQLEEPIATVKQIVEVLEQLKDYSREKLESGYFPKQENRFGQRADKQLIADLKEVRKELENAGLKLEYAHALISRAIFVRYLEDRDVLTIEYFKKVAGNNMSWQALLELQPEKSTFNFDSKKHFFCKVLQNKDFTYALFDKLAEDFNGDLFPKDKIEESRVEQKYLDSLRGFLLGDIDAQQKIFFHLYDFEIVPIELISNIYEEFYSTTKKKDKEKTGSHYTPSVLAEYVISEVLSKERLETNPIILDPACGSGIFLVEAFRRIVRFKTQKKGSSLDADELRDILREQIRGIEINLNAIEITAFSLYLALLHYQNPPDILAQIEMSEPYDKPLPHLIYDADKAEIRDYYNILFNCNAFALIDSERQYLTEKLENKKRFKGRSEIDKLLKFEEILPIKSNSIDIIIGNPPWGTEHTENESSDTKKADGQAKLWCEVFEWEIGVKELCQAFIARSLTLLKETGESGLLVSTGIFFKCQEKSQLFRSQWLKETTVKKIVNFAHVRHVFFSANSPFAFIYYQNKSANYSHKIQHWSAKKLEIIENNQSVILYNSDVRQIKQYDLISNEYLWKTYWWGGHRDASLIRILKMEKTLSKFADKDEKGNTLIGQGFSNGSKLDSKWLQNYPFLEVSKKHRYFHRYKSINQKSFKDAPKKVNTFNSYELYDGYRLLIQRCINETEKSNGTIITRLDNISYCFSDSLHAVKVDNIENEDRKIILGVLWSSLIRYYLFLTSGSWLWHPDTKLFEIRNLPIRLPTDNHLKEKIVFIVDDLRNRENTLLNDDVEIKKLENQLDKAIFELYELSEAEQDLVLDMCETGLEFFYQANKSNAVKPLEKYQEKHQGFIQDLPQNRDTEKGLEGYLYAFLDFWNDELEPEGEFNWRIINPPNNPMLAVVFTTQNKGELLPELQNDLTTEWKSVLERCDKALKRSTDSPSIYIQGMVRSVSDTEIIIIKRNECRLWTRTAAREDAEATLVQAMALQENVRN